MLVGPVTYKICPVCSGRFPLELFPKQTTGKLSRHTYCRICYNAKRRESNRKVYESETKRRWNFKSRYGLSENDMQVMNVKQGGCCYICGLKSSKLKVDHDHLTGKVRNLICHKCNLRMSAIDDEDWCDKAIKYRDLHRLGRKISPR